MALGRNVNRKHVDISSLRRLTITDAWSEECYMDPSLANRFGEMRRVLASVDGWPGEVVIGYYYTKEFVSDINQIIGMTGGQAAQWLRETKYRERKLLNLLRGDAHEEV